MSFSPNLIHWWANRLFSIQPRANASGEASALLPEPQRSPEQVKAISPTAQEVVFMRKLHAIIDQALGQEDFDVEALSQAMAISRMHLHRKLKALTGQSPGQYLRWQRLLRARHLLLHTHHSVGEVAWLVGFKEHATFTRAYKKAFGRLPKQR